MLRALKGGGLLLGTIIGAGMFALPFVVSRAGIFWATIHFILAGLLVTIFQILYGKVIYHHPERHRLPGYVKHYFGNGAFTIVLWVRFFSYYGYLLAYGVLGGVFLSLIFSLLGREVSAEYLSILFFLLLIPFLHMSLKKVGALNILMTVPLIIFAILIPFITFTEWEFSHVELGGSPGWWFLPIGIFLFAFGGASVIPEVVDTIGLRRERLFTKTIILSMLTVALIYIMFVVSVLGIAHGAVPEDAISALQNSGAHGVVYLAGLIGLFAVLTSYIGIGTELRFTWQFDVGMKYAVSWLLVSIAPLMLFVLGINSFIFIIAIVGAVGVGVEGLFITLLARRTLKTNLMLVTILILIIVGGSLLQLLGLFGVFALST